jgi:hypothetical protein
MRLLARIILAGLAYVFGTVVSGMIAGPLHFPTLDTPAGVSPAVLFKILLLATPLLAASVVLLASGLKGSWVKRWGAIGALLFVTLGLNTVIELLIFSNLIKRGGALTSVHWLLPTAFAAAVLTFGSGEKAGTTITRRGLGPMSWGWRLLAAWLAFPVIYLIFGMCVGPFVVEQYKAGIAGLKLPPMSTILLVQLLRSALFLAASLPAVLLWAKSRGQLILALGMAHAVTVGIFGLAQAFWLPTVLRVAHSFEITADSFAYAAILALLFTSGVKASEPSSSQAAVARGY